MQKMTIYEVLNINKTLYKMFKQQSKFPISIGFKLYNIMKKFDEVEEYVFNVMENTFKDFDITNMTDEQQKFYNVVLSSEIELDYGKVNINYFNGNDDLKLTLEDISNLQPIFFEQ